MMAARRVAKLVQEVGLRQSHFEGNSEVGIKVLQDGNMLFSSFGLLVRDTLSFVSPLWGFSFSHTVRQSNAVAHALTQRARLSFLLLVWMECVPPNLNFVVCVDFSARKFYSSSFSSQKKKLYLKIQFNPITSYLIISILYLLP